MTKKLILFTLLLVSIQPLFAQNETLRGRVLDPKTNEALIGVSIQLNQPNKKPQNTVSNEQGMFEFSNLIADSATLRFSYIGYKSKTERIVIQTGTPNRLRVSLEINNKELREVKIEGTQIRAEQKGDTTSMNASAFKVNPDATTEDLVKKMPGITIENGTVKAQGEEVKKVLVNGKEFFGDDAQMALKNLPAEVVDKVQVFNRMSDQAQFTGFNDGNTDKSMNIVTRGGLNGLFGKVFAGYGTDERYQTGATLNAFKGERRITFLGMSNNINQQNFSMQDLFGSSGGGGMRPPGMQRPMGMRGGPGGGFGGMQSGLSNFLVGQQNGVNYTNSAGLNYANKWGNKLDLSASYFFNQTENNTEKDLDRTFNLGSDNKQVYSENSLTSSTNTNHRFNMRMEYNFDTSTSILYTPRLSFQKSNTLSLLNGSTREIDSVLNETHSNYDSRNSGYNLANTVLIRHKLAKAGRTVSLNLNHELSDRNAENYQTSVYAGTTGTNINQLTSQSTTSNTLSANLTYSEPVGKSGQLLLSYEPRLNLNESDKKTKRFDSLSTRDYSTIDSLLSNVFNSTVTTHRSSVNYNLKGERYVFTAGLTHQYLILENNQSFPQNRDFSKPFSNILPNLMLEVKFNPQKSLRTFYRTSTNVPSISQLQNVIDNSNPLILSAGNPDLKQEYSHTLLFRYGNNQTEKGRSIFLFGMANFTNNYIASTSYIASSDIVVNGVALNRGQQLSRPENLSGNYSIRSFLNYGTPVQKLKSNLNLNLGGSYTVVPGLINNLDNKAKTLNLNTGFVLGSNISQLLDFNINYTANFNLVTNTLQAQGNSNFLVHNAGFKLNYMPTTSWVINTDINYSNYLGLGNSFNQEFYLWNAAVAYKFLPRKGAELRLSVFDLLNQNNSINRTVTETYVEDTRTRVLQRYFMLTFTYTIRQFKMMGAENREGGKRPN